MTDVSRTALVTGAGHGLGRALVQGLVAAGAAKVYAADKDIDAVRRLSDTPTGLIEPIELDITNGDDVARAADACADVGLLINNAGIASWSGFLSAASTDGARDEIDVNYFGTLAMARAFAPALSRATDGVMVNVLSIFALTCFQPLATECASKAAALILTQGLRAEFAASGVRVIAAFPGAMDTEMTRNIPGPKQDPAEVAQAILRAVSDPDAPTDVFPSDDVRAIAAEIAADRTAAEQKYAGFGLG